MRLHEKKETDNSFVGLSVSFFYLYLFSNTRLFRSV